LEWPGAILVIACHDELVVECDADQAESVSAWLRQAVVDGMAPLIAPAPVVVEVSISRSWAG
jgi:DNA polymerase I-like protein with 3'-5' exonuclease and polymerase domains